MIESANHLFKNVFLKNRSIRNAEHLQVLVDEFRQWSGDNRYPTGLMGYTPNEVLHGKLPNKNLFTQQINEPENSDTYAIKLLGFAKYVANTKNKTYSTGSNSI